MFKLTYLVETATKDSVKYRFQSFQIKTSIQVHAANACASI